MTRKLDYRWILYPVLALVIFIMFLILTPVPASQEASMQQLVLLLSASTGVTLVLITGMEWFFDSYRKRIRHKAPSTPEIYQSLSVALYHACKELCLLDKITGDAIPQARIDIAAGRDEHGFYLWIKDLNRNITSEKYHYHYEQNHWVEIPISYRAIRQSHSSTGKANRLSNDNL